MADLVLKYKMRFIQQKLYGNIFIKQSLEIEHTCPLAIPIPDELVCEKNESKNKRRKLQ